MFNIGDRVCYKEGDIIVGDIRTGTVTKIVTENLPNYFKEIDADERFNKVVYAIKPDELLAFTNYEGLYYCADYLTGATEQEIKDNISQMHKTKEKRYMKATETLTDLVHFLMVNDIHSEDCDFVAREVAYMRCREFGIEIEID